MKLFECLAGNSIVPIAVLLLASSRVSVSPAARPVAIRADKVYVGDGRSFDNGTVLVSDGRIVVVDFPALGSRNYVAYVLRRPIDDIQPLTDHRGGPGDIVIARIDSDIATEIGTSPLLSTETLAVFSIPDERESSP